MPIMTATAVAIKSAKCAAKPNSSNVRFHRWPLFNHDSSGVKCAKSKNATTHRAKVNTRRFSRKSDALASSSRQCSTTSRCDDFGVQGIGTIVVRVRHRVLFTSRCLTLNSNSPIAPWQLYHNLPRCTESQFVTPPRRTPRPRSRSVRVWFVQTRIHIGPLGGRCSGPPDCVTHDVLTPHLSACDLKNFTITSGACRG